MRLICLISLAATSAGLASGEPQTAQRRRGSRDCGAYCIGIALRLLGEPLPPFEEIKKQAKVDAEGVTSMLNIARALTRYGIAVREVPVTKEPPAGLCIAHVRRNIRGLDTNHFVVVSPQRQRVIWYSPPLWVAAKQWGNLAPRLSPRMLLCRLPDSAARPRLWALVCAAVALMVAARVWVRRRAKGATR